MRPPLTSIAVVAAMSVAAPCTAQDAASYPTRPVTFVVPFAPGGPTDTLGRLLTQKLGERLGKPFIVENRPGAGGNTGSAQVARAAPNGYTLVLGTVSTHGINPSLYKNMPYDHKKDFAPISQISLVPNMLVVNPKLPVEFGSRAGRVSEAEPGQGVLRDAGLGHIDPPRLRAPQDDDRHRDDARPLQGQRARHAGRHLGPGAADVRQHGHRLAARAARATCGRSACPRRAGSRSRPTFRRSPSSCPASRPAPGTACSRRPVRRHAIVDKLARGDGREIMKDPDMVAQTGQVRRSSRWAARRRQFAAFIDEETDRWAARRCASSV